MSTANSGLPPKPLADRLVLEAVAIVRASGPDSLSLREVQRRAGVSPAAAYRHFRDRAALLLAVAQKSAGLLAEHIAAAIAAAPDTAPDSDAGAVTARARLLAGCQGYIDFAVENPGLYRAIFFSDEQIEDLVTPSEWARNSAGDGGYNLLVAAVRDVVISTSGSQPDDWDPLVIWSACHGLAMLRLDAALRSLSDEGFAQARDRVLATITMAVPLTTMAEPP